LFYLHITLFFIALYNAKIVATNLLPSLFGCQADCLLQPTKKRLKAIYRMIHHIFVTFHLYKQGETKNNFVYLHHG